MHLSCLSLALPLNINVNESHPRKGIGHCLVMLTKPPSIPILEPIPFQELKVEGGCCSFS